MKNKVFQIGSMLWHRISAWNTGGEGIHSPRLFYLVRHLFYETAQLYAWDTIEERRQAMLRAPKKVHICDFGTGQDRDELVMNIARKSVMKRAHAQLLSRLVHYMSGHEYVPGRQEPLHILELGTSLGLTTAYLASVDSRNEVVTLEGSPEIAEMAVWNWNKLGLDNIRQIKGNIDDTLTIYARDLQAQGQALDFVLMDANHTGEASLRYFALLHPLMDKNGIIVMDDIRYSPDMYEAWRKITRTQGVTASFDLGQLGILFFDPNLQQQTYTIRL